MKNAPRIIRRGGMLLAVSLAAVSVGTSASAPPGRYAVNEGSVTDAATGLIWQRDVDPGIYDWSAAAAYCSSLSLDGSSGWRLPNVKELQSIVDVRASFPAIDTTAFPSTPSDYFWASTQDVEFPSYRWAVDFRTGEILVGVATADARVRCVR